MIEDLKRADTVTISAASRIRGTVSAPPDKSISHRALFLNALSDGEGTVRNYLEGIDNLRTIHCLRALGVRIVHEPGERVIVRGIGSEPLRESPEILDVGTSAGTFRFLAGLVAADDIYSVLTGVPRTLERPMSRIVRPLRVMGATVLGRRQNTVGPLAIRGGPLRGTHHVATHSSGEVKTALLLAGLRAKSGTTTIESPLPSRDHTERMLRAMGHTVATREGGRVVSTEPLREPLQPLDFKVPGEISAAVYWIVLGLVHPDSDLVVQDVGLNPTRTGLLDVLRRMGADLDVRPRTSPTAVEPTGDIRVRSSRLHGVRIDPTYFPRMVDEFPGFALAASLAEGETVFEGASDLRNKKANRIRSIIEGYRSLGACIRETEEGMVFEGVAHLTGAPCSSHGDHRTGNSLIAAGLVAKGESTVEDVRLVTSTSYPDFWDQVIECCGEDVIKDFK